MTKYFCDLCKNEVESLVAGSWVVNDLEGIEDLCQDCFERVRGIKEQLRQEANEFMTKRLKELMQKANLGENL